MCARGGRRAKSPGIRCAPFLPSAMKGVNQHMKRRAQSDAQRIRWPLQPASLTVPQEACSCVAKSLQPCMALGPRRDTSIRPSWRSSGHGLRPVTQRSVHPVCPGLLAAVNVWYTTGDFNERHFSDT